MAGNRNRAVRGGDRACGQGGRPPDGGGRLSAEKHHSNTGPAVPGPLAPIRDEAAERLLSPEGWATACCAEAQALAIAAYDMTRTQMTSKSRGAAWVAEGRQVAMYLAHVIAQVAPSDAAPHFRRDRTTIAHACKVVEDKRDDNYFDGGLERLESLMMQRLGEMKMRRLLAQQQRLEAAGVTPDDHITIEKPLIIKTAKGKVYRFEILPDSG